MDSTGLRIRLLGELELQLGERPLPPLGSARAASLLAYLLIHRAAPQPRQRVAFLLWPDSSEPQARTNLRHVLHTLRRALPDADRLLDVTPRTLRWRPDAPAWLDVEAFEAALARDDLRAATALYGGDLLAGAYDEWLHAERERLRGLQIGALDRLAGRLEAAGESAEAIAVAERLLRHDPLREDAHRRLMRLHAARGDRARALRAYHACAALLERELGVAPSAATRELYEALLPAPAPGAPAAGRPALVGRAAEWARLTQLWAAAERGRAQLVLVTGEPGIGKTRLVDELRAWCEARGAATAGARSYAAEGELAYGPVAAWLRAPALAARRPGPGERAELARLLPELGDAPAAAGEQRARLFAAAARALLAPAAPLLLVADDLQWADHDTLQLLHYLVRAHPTARLLVAATARREELDPPHPLHELLTGLGALGRCEELALGRLSRADTAALAAGIRGAPLAPGDAERLFAETEGNPLFAVEALRAGRRAGAPLSPRVHAVIAARLAQLSAPTRELAGVAAAIGRPFTAELLGSVSGLDADALVRGLDELWRRRIVREEDADAYDFTHGRIREVAEDGLGPARRGGHHRRIAAELERLHAGDPLAVAAQVAFHHDRAGARAAAARWYALAAEAAERMQASHEAMRLGERGLAVARALPAGAERDAAELALLAAIVAPLATVHGYGSAPLAAAQRRALELAPEPEPRILRSTAVSSLTLGGFEDARRAGEQLRARGERAADEALTAEAHYVLGIAAFWEARLEAARTHFEAAVERFRPAQRAAHVAGYGFDPEVICLSRLANTLWFLGRADAAVEVRERALALAARVGHETSTGVAHVFGALLALELRDADGVRRGVAALGPAPGNRAVAATRDALAGYIAVLDGRPGAGVAGIRRVLDAARGADPAPGLHASVVRVLLEACVATGDARAGLAATELPPGPGGRLWEAERLRLRARFLAALGAPDAAVEAELEAALAVAREQGAPLLELRAATALLRRRGDDAPLRARVAALAAGPATWESAEAAALLGRGGTLAERRSGDPARHDHDDPSP